MLGAVEINGSLLTSSELTREVFNMTEEDPTKEET